jgi:mono/diheme cytochrome c family protein
MISYGCGSPSHEESRAEGSVEITQLTDLPSRPVTRGEKLYEHYCSFCHGKQGEGDGLNAFSLSKPPRNFTDSEAVNAKSHDELVEIISTGGEAFGFTREMPPYGNTLTSAQISDLVRHIRTLARQPEENEGDRNSEKAP